MSSGVKRKGNSTKVSKVCIKPVFLISNSGILLSEALLIDFPIWFLRFDCSSCLIICSESLFKIHWQRKAHIKHCNPWCSSNQMGFGTIRYWCTCKLNKGCVPHRRAWSEHRDNVSVIIVKIKEIYIAFY